MKRAPADGSARPAPAGTPRSAVPVPDPPPGNAPAASLPAIALLALVCTLGGQALFTYALGFVSADVVSFALLGEPVGAAIWAYLLFGEQVTAPLLAGGAVVLIGLAWYMLGEMRAARRS